MLPPIKITIPKGVKAIYITTHSLYQKLSKASLDWTDGSASFGATFEGPSPSYVLGDIVFGQPIIVVGAMCLADYQSGSTSAIIWPHNILSAGRLPRAFVLPGTER